MTEAFAKVAELIANNAVHRRGFCMNDATPILAAGHAVSEAAETLDALLFNKPVWDDVLHEIADTVGCLIHLCLMLNISEEELEAAIIRKLEQRFTCGSKKSNN